MQPVVQDRLGFAKYADMRVPSSLSVIRCISFSRASCERSTYRHLSIEIADCWQNLNSHDVGLVRTQYRAIHVYYGKRKPHA